jgi:hypothetical protein
MAAAEAFTALVRGIWTVECCAGSALAGGAGGSSRMRQASGVFVCLVGLLVCSPQARAEDGNPGGVGVGLVAGTTGVGGELSIRPIGNFVVRAVGGWFALDHDFTIDAKTYNLRADMISAGATLDWHAFGNGFRLSAGGRYHTLDFSGTGNFTGAFTIGNNLYTSAQTGLISVSVKSAGTVVPYLGIGYDSTHFSESRWALALDLGVIYGGKPTSTVAAANVAAVPGLAADLLIEQKKFDDAVGKYGQFWPVATLALKYRF